MHFSAKDVVSLSHWIGSLETCWEMERTFAIIKPDAMRNGKAEAIMNDIQNAGADCPATIA